MDRRGDDGDVRVEAIGGIDDRRYSVVHTLRGEVHWIVPARPSSRKEREIWRWACDPRTRPGDRPGSISPKSEATTEAGIEASIIAEGERPEAPLEGYHVVVDVEPAVRCPKQNRDACGTDTDRSA